MLFAQDQHSISALKLLADPLVLKSPAVLRPSKRRAGYGTVAPPTIQNPVLLSFSHASAVHMELLLVALSLEKTTPLQEVTSHQAQPPLQKESSFANVSATLALPLFLANPTPCAKLVLVVYAWSQYSAVEFSQLGSVTSTEHLAPRVAKLPSMENQFKSGMPKSKLRIQMPPRVRLLVLKCQMVLVRLSFYAIVSPILKNIEYPATKYLFHFT